MLQQKTTGHMGLDMLRQQGLFPPSWSSLEELEAAADAMHARLLMERQKAAGMMGPGFMLPEALDTFIRTNEPEHMDREEVSPEERLRLVQALHRQNSMLGIYGRYRVLLEPLIRELASSNERPARLLELAGATGGLSLALAEAARDQGLPLTLTSSDITEAFVEEGRRHAQERGLEIEFLTLDAFRLDGLEHGSFDLVLLSQSLHHFTPGQLAVMIAGAERIGAAAFVGIDGFRGLLTSLGLPLIALLQGDPFFTMDGLLSSRKFYSEPELDAIAETATGRRNHAVATRWPMSLLCVRFDGSMPHEGDFPLF